MLEKKVFMNILTKWQKKITQVTKKDTRSMLLLSYKRLVQCLIAYAYYFVPILVSAAVCVALNSTFSQYVFSFFAVFLSQLTVLLLRTSMYKKDIAYLLSMIQHNYGLLITFPVLSLIVPMLALPVFLAFVVLFQLIAADGRIRLLSVIRIIRATLLLVWYNLPAVLLFVLVITGFLAILLPLLKIAQMWLQALLVGSLYLVLMMHVAFLVLVYIMSIYEHEQELL
jgi:hypothetical protein